MDIVKIVGTIAASVILLALITIGAKYFTPVTQPIVVTEPTINKITSEVGILYLECQRMASTGDVKGAVDTRKCDTLSEAVRDHYQFLLQKDKYQFIKTLTEEEKRVFYSIR